MRMTIPYLRYWIIVWPVIAVAFVIAHIASLSETGELSSNLILLASPVQNVAENYFPNVVRIKDMLRGVDTPYKNLILSVHSVMSMIFILIMLVPFLIRPDVFLNSELKKFPHNFTEKLAPFFILTPLFFIASIAVIFLFPVGLNCGGASFVCNKSHENFNQIIYVPIHYFCFTASVVVIAQYIRNTISGRSN